MAQLHYHRWQTEFQRADFSSEASMRDYLYRNPSIVVAKNDATDPVIPIGEEVSLPESKLAKVRGRADIIFIKINKNDQPGADTHKQRLISKGDAELWICELKKVEATYQNGLEQLLDYMS